MNSWSISDKHVVDVLRANGFTCEKPKSYPLSGGISFLTRPLEEERAAEEASTRYETDCPIEWNGTYTLPDGQVLRSSGTSLILEREEQR